MTFSDILAKTKSGVMAVYYSLFVLLAASFLTACHTPAPQNTQLITPAMTVLPIKPKAPDPALSDQRDVALYIVLLRGWGDAMAIQLKAIEKLITPDK